MAQMKTRWYSGKISTSSSVEKKQNAKIEEPQISKSQFLKSRNNSSTFSKISLKRQAASGSVIQAGKKPDAESKQPYPKSKSTTTSNITTTNTPQLQQKNGACNQQISQTKPNAKKSDEVEFNISLKTITAYNKQQANNPNSPVTSIDFNYWFPYIFMQTLRRKLQESASRLTANKLLEVQFYDNEMTSVTDNTTERCLERYHPRYPAYPAYPIRKPISYKCPRKKPKFKARFVEIKNTADENESFTKSTSKPKTSEKSINSERELNTSTCSPSLTEPSFDRNISPVSKHKSFKWPSDAELKLNLASISPSSISSTESIISYSSSVEITDLQTLPTNELTPYEIPASPRDHELYLAAIEQLKNSIKDSRKQRSRLDQENLLTSNEKKILKTNENEEISDENEILTTDTNNRLKTCGKRTSDKSNKQQKIIVKKAQTLYAKTESKLSATESQLSEKKSSNSEKDLLKNRLKRFIEESKSVTTSLDVAAVNANYKSRTSDILQLPCHKSETSQSSSSSDEHIQHRLKRFIAESRAGSTFDTETATELRSALKPSESERTYEKQRISSRIFDNLKISAHDRQQLAAIDSLKQRLKRSIKEFKKRVIPLDQQEQMDETTNEATYTLNTLKLSGTGNDNKIKDVSNTSELKLKPKRSIKVATKNKQQSPNKETFKRNDLYKAKDNKEQTVKSRSFAHTVKCDQTKDHPKTSIKDSRKQGKQALEADETFTRSGILKSHLEKNNLKQSKAQTSLHCKKVGKENKTPTETSNSKQFCTHKKTKDSLQKTKSSAKSNDAHHTEIPANSKSTNPTHTKGTQCEHVSDLRETENFSTEMELQTLLDPHTTRSEALSAVLKFRYKSLIERAKGEFAWLQLKKQRYKTKGLHEHIAAVRKKQQQILKKMESERSMIQQLLESALSTPYLQADSAKYISAPKQQQKAKLTPSKSAPDMGMGQESNEPQPSLSQRLRRVEYMLAWNFKLDQKEADITELEHMLLDCNKNINLSPATSIKSLLYRISNVESRLAKINEKLETLESSAMMVASTHLLNELNEVQQRSSSKLNQFWQRLTTEEYQKSMPKTRNENKVKKNYNNPETATGCNDLSTNHESSESSSSQYVIFDPANYLNKDKCMTNDDGIVVLYSPKVPSLNLNFSSCQTDLTTETMPTTSSVANSTFSISRRQTKTTNSERKSNKSK